MYGGKLKEMLNEESPFEPKSPYAASKVFAHDLTKIYRESYGIFSVNGILFNHESPMRGETFVTRKITRAVGRIANKIQSKLTLGNLMHIVIGVFGRLCRRYVAYDATRHSR